MSRLDEMIYHLETMAKSFEHNIGTKQQVVQGKNRFCCSFCGHCPAAEAEWLREIAQEVRANSSSSRELANPTPNLTTKESDL